MNPNGSPSLHFHHEGLFELDLAAVDDHTLGVGQVTVVSVLELDGVNHRLRETDVNETVIIQFNQLLTDDYGTTILINTETKLSRIMTLLHF